MSQTTTTAGKQYQQNSATGVSSRAASARIGSEMNDETFARIVAEDVKNNSTASQQEYLSMPHNRERWKRALVALIENLDSQIARLEEDEEDDVDRYRALGKDGVALVSATTSTYEARRHKIERFKFYVQGKLDKVVAMAENEEFLSRADLFEKAIRQHRALMEEYDMEGTAADEALWATLDGRWEFDNVKM